MRVRDVMSSPAVMTAPEAPIKNVAAQLAEKNFTSMPVLDRGELLGLVGEADLLAGRFPPDPRIPRAGGWDPGLGDKVRDVMHTEVFVVAPSQEVGNVLVELRAVNSRMAPVVERGVVTGVVTFRDLLRALARDDALIAADVRRRIGVYAGAGHWVLSVSNGEVRLSGEDRDASDRGVLERIAESVIGVTAVRFTTPALAEQTP
jgi:CBS domain-containing protein